MDNLKKIYIIGAGGLAKEVAWLIERINSVEKKWELCGFIDKNEELYGTFMNRYRILGDIDYLKNINNVYVVCAIANVKIRKRIINDLKQYNNVSFATLIDPSVIISQTSRIGEGSIISFGTIVTVDSLIGKHTILNYDCTIGHDVVIEDYVTIYPSVNVSGNVLIKECTEIGTGTQIIQGLNIGSQSIIGAGSVVIRDIPDKCTAVGSPAKPIKYF